MMKTKCFWLLVVIHVGLLIPLSAQNGVWTWVYGSNTANPPASFGIQGVASPTNQPPATYGPNSWTDLNGNFWILGGSDNSVVTSYWGCLWKYDVTLGQWTWMKGPSTPNNSGIYGVQGVPSPLNRPGARAFGSNTWTDNANNLWLFGGFGYDANGTQGEMNDLWKYDISTNEWTWVGGSSTVNGTGSFGTLQVPSPTNMPSFRSESTANWVDAAGDLWLFGGSYYDDVWRYNPATNIWTWMAGNNMMYATPVYGTQGVSSPTNTPGQRWVYAHWTDQQGKFWIYGGFCAGFVLGADMWKFDPVTLEWTWMAGSSLPNVSNTFTQQCVPGGHPGATYEGRTYWTDDCGRFWHAHGAGGATVENYMWMFDPVTNQFTWINGALGPSTPTNFGTQNVPATTNYPPGLLGTASFRDLNGDLCFFGGYDFVTTLQYNTIWRYQIDPVCPGNSVTATFSSLSSNSGCAPFTTQFTPSVNSYTSYQWDFGDTTTTADTSSSASPTWTFTQPGTYSVTLITSGVGACGAGTDTTTQLITVYASPVASLGADTTLCTAPVNLVLDAQNNGSSYLWSTGATSQTINATSPGNFSVTITAGPNGLCSSSDTIVVSLATQPTLGNDTAICEGQTLLLNPAASAQQYIWNTGDTTATLLVSNAGFYSVQVITQSCSLTTSINLNLLPLPVVNLGNDTVLCPNEVLLLNAQNSGSTYNWNTGATSQTITATQSGNYSVIVTNQSCFDSDTLALTVIPPITLDRLISLCGSRNGVVLDAGITGANYLWNTGETTQTITVQQAGEYSVLVTTPECQLRDTVDVTGSLGEGVIYVPNSFTPNGDGLNERFSGVGEDFTKFHLIIFNRWGEKIFETFDPNGWDGTYQGAPAKGDVYVYLLSYTSACTGGKFVDQRGHVTLIR